MGILVIVLFYVIVYLCKDCKVPQKAWQFNFARKSNAPLNGGNLHNTRTAQCKEGT